MTATACRQANKRGGGGLLRRSVYYAAHNIQSRFGFKRPLLGGIKLTHACNLKCRHCPFHHKPAASLAFEQALAALRDLHRRGVRLLIIEGGEPFLWQDGVYRLEDIVRAAQSLFFCVGVTTNGTFPMETGADILWVSIDGLAVTHDLIRGRSFETLTRHLEVTTHPAVYAHVTINVLNHAEIPELAVWLAERVKGITIQFHYPYGEGEEDLSLSITERQQVLDRLITLKRQGLPIADSFVCLEALKENTWRCRPWMIASIDPDGTITQGCYAAGRGRIDCTHCGFAAHAEMSLAYSGRPGSILNGMRIFNRRRV